MKCIEIHRVFGNPGLADAGGCGRMRADAGGCGRMRAGERDGRAGRAGGTVGRDGRAGRTGQEGWGGRARKGTGKASHGQK